MQQRVLLAVLLWLQGVLNIAWWYALFQFATFRQIFEVANDPRFLNAYLLPDLYSWIGGSFLAGWALYRDYKWKNIACFFLLGASLYSLGHAVSIWWITQSGTPGLVLMLPGVALNAYATALSRK